MAVPSAIYTNAWVTGRVLLARGKKHGRGMLAEPNVAEMSSDHKIESGENSRLRATPETRLETPQFLRNELPKREKSRELPPEKPGTQRATS